MKIIQNGVPVIDTDKMTDSEAEIYEASVNLMKICEKYNAPLFSTVIRRGYKPIYFYNLKNSEKPTQESMDCSSTDITEAICSFLYSMTGGRIKVVKIK